MKIKLFAEYKQELLERKVNDFIEELPSRFIQDIKFSSLLIISDAESKDGTVEDLITKEYSAMVIYEGK